MTAIDPLVLLMEYFSPPVFRSLPEAYTRRHGRYSGYLIMRKGIWNVICGLSSSAVCIMISACGSPAEVREDAKSLAITQPIISGADPQLEVDLEWVIVRNGPGSWADNADWDEYLIRLTNRSEYSVRISSVHVYDSLNTAIATSGRRPELVKQSKKTVARYRSRGLEVKAGVGGDALVAASAATYIAATATGVAVLTGSVAATAVTTGAVVAGAFVVPPILLINASSRNKNNSQVAQLISDRQTELPLILAPGEIADAHFFFPLAPSPIKIVIEYRATAEEHRLLIETDEVLGRLHIGDAQDAHD